MEVLTEKIRRSRGVQPFTVGFFDLACELQCARTYNLPHLNFYYEKTELIILCTFTCTENRNHLKRVL